MQCNEGEAIDKFYDLLYRKPTVWALVGPSCAGPTMRLADIVPLWSLLQVSFI